MFFARALLLFSLALSAHALATPHIARAHHHRAISARLVAVEADAQPAQPAQPIQPRKLSKRCKPRSSHFSHSHSHSHPSTPSTTPAQQPTSTSQPQQYPTSASHHHHNTMVASPPAEQTTDSPSTPSTTSEAPPSTSTHTSSGGGSGINLPSFLIGIQTGQGTYYSTGLGACGITNTDSQHIAAVSHLLFDAFPGYDGVNPNANPVCGRKVNVEYQGKSVTVTITDRCTGCKLTDLDFSPSAFDILSDPSVGRLSDMKWSWL